MIKPLIGITTDGEYSKTVNPYPHFKVRQTYAQAVEAAGGVPIMLPWSVASVERYAREIDGLVVVGGDDINPAFYGEEAVHPTVSLVFPERTQFEWAMLDMMSVFRKPVFGICGGMQLMNVWAGGSLYQDISLAPGCEIHEKGRGCFFSHNINVEKDSWLHHAVGEEAFWVNSFHHQVVKDLSSKFKATAWSDDGCVEFIESLEAPGWVGSQWHPEYSDGRDAALIQEWMGFCR